MSAFDPKRTFGELSPDGLPNLLTHSGAARGRSWSTFRRSEKVVAPRIKYFVRQPGVSDRP